MTSAPIDAAAAAAGFRLVAVCAAVSIAAELILAVWAYNKPAFLALRDTIERQARAPTASSTAQKAAARLEKSLKNELISVMAPIRLKQMAVGTAATFGLFKGVMARLAPGEAVAALPFAATAPPLSWLARRGLAPDTPLDAAAATLLFALVQVGVRQVAAKLLDAGPTPRMTELQAQFGAEAGFGPGLSQANERAQAAVGGSGGGRAGGGGAGGSGRTNKKKK